MSKLQTLNLSLNFTFLFFFGSVKKNERKKGKKVSARFLQLSWGSQIKWTLVPKNFARNAIKREGFLFLHTFFFFFLIHMENKCINANRIILSQENWLGISLQGIARHLKYCLPESPGDEGCRTTRLSDCSSLISLYRQLGNDYCSLISLYRQQRSQQ